MRKYLLVIGLCLSTGSLAADNGLELLEKMSEAMHVQNYSGTFVYHHKDKVETLKIVHRNTPEGVDERVLTLSGKPREIIRRGPLTTCILPENHLVIVDDNQSGSHFPGIVPKKLHKLQLHYDIKVSESDERMAGKLCWVVDIMPKDKYRYGYRLWIDKETHLLVRSDLLNEQQETIEQVMFTELNLHESLPDKVFMPEFLADGFRRQQIGKPADVNLPSFGRWRAYNLPPGFIMQTQKQRVKYIRNKPAHQIVISDGLASVSVYIEPKHDNRVALGRKTRGAMSVFGKVYHDHHLTVVGEVPERTVELIAESIRLEKEP